MSFGDKIWKLPNQPSKIRILLSIYSEIEWTTSDSIASAQYLRLPAMRMEQR